MLPKVIDIQIKVEFNPGINVEPNTKIGPDDTVLGKISPYQKKLFVLAEQLKIIANNSFEASNGADANGMKKLLEAKACELSEKAESLMMAFAIDVMDTYSLWSSYDKIDLGIRNGWWIVWTKAEEEEIASYEIGITNN